MPVLNRLVSISTGLVPEPALCLDASAAERSQETPYVKRIRTCKHLKFILFLTQILYYSLREQAKNLSLEELKTTEKILRNELMA